MTVGAERGGAARVGDLPADQSVVVLIEGIGWSLAGFAKGAVLETTGEAKGTKASLSQASGCEPGIWSKVMMEKVPGSACGACARDTPTQLSSFHIEPVAGSTITSPMSPTGPKRMLPKYHPSSLAESR